MTSAKVLSAAALLGLAVAPVTAARAQAPVAELELPTDVTAVGEDFRVTLTYRADEDVELEAWRLGPAALLLDGEPAGDRSRPDVVPLAAGSTLTLELEVGELLTEGRHRLALDGGREHTVTAYRGLAQPPEFMTIPQGELEGYRALFLTNRGGMLFEFFPETAPAHVRNFLDLTASGFYEGVQFHRVSPNFMVQGGCPNTRPGGTGPWGAGQGPRQVEAEFSDRNHERGILSMARLGDPNSATSQFFIVTRKSSQLDGQYSVFGRLVAGDDTLTRISEAQGEVNPRDYTVRPSSPQRILRTFVLPPERRSEAPSTESR